MITHTSLKAELLYLLGRSSAPMSGADLYERSEMADEVIQVAKALGNLRDDGKIVRAAGDGRARYTLAAGVAAPAPAGKAGRSKAVRADDAAQDAVGSIHPAPDPAPDLPALDIPMPDAPDHFAGTGKMVDALIAKTRSALRSQPGAAARWWIDQDGGVEIWHGDEMVALSAEQARRMGLMIVAVGDAREEA